MLWLGMVIGWKGEEVDGIEDNYKSFACIDVLAAPYVQKSLLSSLR